jgi:hypothetical protein
MGTQLYAVRTWDFTDAGSTPDACFTSLAAARERAASLGSRAATYYGDSPFEVHRETDAHGLGRVWYGDEMFVSIEKAGADAGADAVFCVRLWDETHVDSRPVGVFAATAAARRKADAVVAKIARGAGVEAREEAGGATTRLWFGDDVFVAIEEVRVVRERHHGSRPPSARKRRHTVFYGCESKN